MDAVSSGGRVIGIPKLAEAPRRTMSVVRKLGVFGAAHYLLKERIIAAVRMAMPWSRVGALPYSLYSPECSTVIWCRPFTSDRLAFAQIFVDRGYPVPSHVDPRLIVDCGANVGYASLFFLSRFPNARVVAVEPDDRNYALLQRNLSSFGARAQTIHGAVWRREAGLRVLKGTYRDGLEWATQVRECGDGETPDLVGMTIGSVLAQANADVIDILKIDIEGAEAEVFAGDTEWVDRVRVLMVELHDARSARAFQRLLAGRPFKTSVCGELTVAQRVHPGEAS